ELLKRVVHGAASAVGSRTGPPRGMSASAAMNAHPTAALAVQLPAAVPSAIASRAESSFVVALDDTSDADCAAATAAPMAAIPIEAATWRTVPSKPEP